jgi:hypothetical protein
VASLHAQEGGAAWRAPARGQQDPRPLDSFLGSAYSESARRTAHGRDLVHNGGTEASVHRRLRRTTRGSEKRRRARSGAELATSSSIPISRSRFRNYKTPKSVTYSKISKTKSCRGAIDLQISQREIYVLINGKILTKLQKFSAPSYCSQRVQLDFWPICTQNLNVRQLRKMCSRK